VHHPQTDGQSAPRDDCPLAMCSADGVERSGEETFWRSDGTPLFVHYTCTPLEKGGAVVAFQDLTERIRMARQLKQAERVSSLGRLAATITHEFNNVLMSMAPFAQIIRRHATEEETSHAAGRLLSAIQRGRQITSQILRMAGTSDPPLTRLDIAAWFRRHHPDLSAVAKDQTEVHLDVDDEPLHIRCDAAQLQQVIVNLVINASDAMRGRGVVDIKVRRDHDNVRIDVADHGEGIRPEVLPDIFEPLFTTKLHGTGLGLSVAQQLVCRNGGTIDVESRVGEGTTFILHFPLVEE